MAKFARKGTDMEIRVQTMPHRLYPSLIVVDDGHADIVASFKTDEAARSFVKALTKILRGDKHG